MSLSLSLSQQYTAKHGLPTPTVTVHESLSDVIVIRGSGPRSESVRPHDGGRLPEVIVGRGCGQAVLRGAEVYAPGVVGMPSHVAAGDTVGIKSPGRPDFTFERGAKILCRSLYSQTSTPSACAAFRRSSTRVGRRSSATASWNSRGMTSSRAAESSREWQ